jgi:hypothetical protein
MVDTLNSLTGIKEVQRQNEKRAKDGYFLSVPTVAEIFTRHNWIKGWYEPRNAIIKMSLEMLLLENPAKKEPAQSLQTGKARLEKDGRVVTTTATFPFDSYSLATSMLYDKHPYVTLRPVVAAHEKKGVLADADKFAQSALDMQLMQQDLLPDMVASPFATGWLITRYAYDPALAARGAFPYELEVLDPLTVYPHLDHRGQPLWVTIEERLTGAQLIEKYIEYPGVRELFDHEPDSVPESSDAYRKRLERGNSLYTAEFDVIRYYDSHVTALLLTATTVTETAIRSNTALARLSKRTKDGLALSLLSDPDGGSNEYAGVCLHNLGQIPINIQGCWRVPLRATSMGTEHAAYYERWGRVTYLPFLFSQYENWLRISRLLSMMETLMLKRASAPVVTNDPDLKSVNTDFIRLGEGRDLRYLEPPGMSQEMMTLMQQAKSEVEQGSYARSASGAVAGTSGRQQDMSFEAGSIRENVLIRAVERACAAYPAGVIRTMIARGGDEKYFVSGDGKKYGTKSVTIEYSPEKLGGVVPFIDCELKSRNGLKDPTNAAIYRSLKESGLPDEFILQRVLDEPGADAIIEQMKKQEIGRTKEMLELDLKLAVLERQKELLPKLARLEWDVQREKDKQQLWIEEQQAQLDVTQIPAERRIAQLQAQLMKAQQAMQEMMNPAPPMLQSPNSAPNMPGSMPTSPRGIGQMMPPPQSPPNGMPSNQPQMTPEMMQRLAAMRAMQQGAGGVPSQVGSPMPPPGMPVPPRPPMQPGGNVAPVNNPRDAAIGKAPGQAQQPIQPLSRQQPAGGVGRPGMASPMVGSGSGMPGTPITLNPAIATANRSVAEPTPAAKPKRKRGRRG